MEAVDAHPGGDSAGAEAGAGHGRGSGVAHIPALDGLRGTAVAGVLAYHLGHLRGGYLGVDLFFVLSGFLITSLLLTEHRTAGRIDLNAFWSRRMRRLLPALWLLLIGVAAYSVVVARAIDLPGIRADAFATLAYVANWHAIAGGASYWNISLAPSPLQHTWSLAIEEQFYVVWPLAFVLLAAWQRRHRRRAGGQGDLADLVLMVAAIGAAASAIGLVALHAGGASDTRVYEGTDTRAAALLLGVALAAWRSRLARAQREARPGRLVEAVGVAATLALGGLWLALDGQSPWVYRGGLAAASLLATATVAAASRPASPILGRAFGLTPLRWLGAISYGLYLWHWPIYQGLDAMNGRYPGLGPRHLVGGELIGAKVSLSLLAAIASYRLIEQPVRRGKVPTRWVPVAVGAGAVTATLAIVLATLGGITPDRIGPPADGRSGHVARAPVVLVVGDSVALSVASRLYADPARFAVNPVDHTRIGCSIAATGHRVRSFTGQRIRPDSCQRFALDGIAAVKPDVVYVLVGSRPNDAIEVDGAWTTACDPAFDDNYREAEISFVRDLRATGAQVVVGTVLRSGAASLPVDRSEERIACVNRVIASLPAAVPGVHVVDNNRLLCPGTGPCLESLGGDPVRTDGLHFDQGPGGDRVVEWIMARIRALVPPKDPEPSSDLARLAGSLPPRTIDWLERVSQQAVGQGMAASRVQYWGRQLVEGAPRAAVTQSLVDSASWRRHRVRLAYRHWLRSEPSPEGLEHWQHWLEHHSTSELDLHLASTVLGRDARGTTDPARARHLANALGLPSAAAGHFEHQLATGMSWTAVVREGYFSQPAADVRMSTLAPRSNYTPAVELLIAEFRASQDERAPLVRALATLA